MSAPFQTLEALNSLQASDFVGELAEVFEHAPWVAEAAAAKRPYRTVQALHEAMMGAVHDAPPERQTAFIGSHPELGSRFKRADLTDHSKAEQGGLGLDRLSDQEFVRFSELNAAYRAKFGFPFIICVRRHTRDSILQQFERRLRHAPEAERAAALEEIGLITRLRLVAKVDGPGKPVTTGRLSTHVLDLHSGRPAAGVPVTLHEVGDSARALLRETVTNADGRTDAPLILDEPLRIGTYELTFRVGDYFRSGAILRDAVRSLPSGRASRGPVGTAPQDEAQGKRPHPEERALASVSKDGPKALPFFDIIPIRFSIVEPEAHYHVPLLVTPFAYTTYRGS